MTCRTEGDNTYKQEYNADRVFCTSDRLCPKNRISSMQLIEGSCVEPTSITFTWPRLLRFGPFLSEELHLRRGWGEGDASL